MQPRPSRLLTTRLFFSVAIIFLFIALVGCGGSAPLTNTTPNTENPTSDTENPASPDTTTSEEPAQVMTVMLGLGDTREVVQQRFGGTVLVWEDNVYAILKAEEPTETQAAARQSSNVTLENNSKAFKSLAEVGMSGRTRLWSGGRTRLWSGGSSEVWAEGRTRLWSGGEFSWLPENTTLWQQIRLEQGHSLAPNLGHGVKVAVIDTGVDLQHPALQEALAPAGEWYDFYSDDAVPQEEGTFEDAGYGHGTNVAGIIRQIAPRATLLPIRVLGPDGGGDVADVAAGIQWAVAKGAKVINLSLGSEKSLKAVEEVIKQATSKGVLVVASTGNTGDKRVTWPASSAEKNLLRLSVTSVDSTDKKSSFATYGETVELSAPGENVFGPAPELTVAAWSGTSQAAPMASGALALALGQTLVVPGHTLANELRVRASDVYNNSMNQAYKDGLGKGRLNLEEFLRNVVKH
jgi:thermitase